MVGRTNAEVGGSKAEAVISGCYEALDTRSSGGNELSGSEGVQSRRKRKELILHGRREGSKE